MILLWTALLLASPLSAQEWDNGYTEQEFHKVLSVFVNVYDPIVAAEGGTFEIDADWTDGSVNAFAWREGKIYRIEVPGGLSRYSLFNEEAYILMICHELGHLLGGEPSSHQISFEGQSDYYSTEVCMKLVLPHIEDRAGSATREVQDLCRSDRICERSLLAAEAMGRFDAKLAKTDAPKFSTPDLSVVSKTLQTHPSPQCRLDTRKAGALAMPRPACWYRELSKNRK